MKILSVVIPSYNSEEYLDRCVDSILPAGEDVEIIIVNDGSTDRTAEIADDYADKFPSIVKVIHKENGGHGSTINSGIKAATGWFFKVVDSDDRLDPECLKKVIDVLKKSIEKNTKLDMLLCNYVYDKQGAKHKFVMKPKGIPKDQLLNWDDIRHIRKYHYILMHSIIYRTDLLRLCDLELPEHTYYVDNIYAFQPLPYVKTFCYKDIDLYWYFIGREGQSVSEEKLVKQIDQYIFVIKIMTKVFKESKYITNSKPCLDYMLNYLEVVFGITCNFLNVGKDPANIQKKKDLWAEVEKIDPDAAAILKKRLVVVATNLPGKGGRAVSKYGYRALSKLLGLN
ncbi:MAG: glycosyltransferase family 2 protein [Eubacterium sp.]|nr:glycosyltransferase family 2 protein [Eubacterium sp.]